MDIVVHYPKDPDRLRELQQKVAVVHAEAVVRRIQSIPCPKQQKEELLRSIIKGAHTQ